MPIRRHVAFSRATPLHTRKARRSRDRSLFTSVSLRRAFAVSRQVRSCRVLASFLPVPEQIPGANEYRVSSLTTGDRLVAINRLVRARLV